MAEIPIREYLHYIDQLIENSRLHEATAHCYHILEQHARHIDTYRMLGKALLEQGEADDAINIFQRVLSAEPEDFIAHAGLAILYKEQGALPQAIWHMERAFEADPYNEAVRQELMGLYAAREEGSPERITLTRAALARLYARGDLYQQAESELRALLESDKSRVDLHALLAEVLWRHQQRVEAVELCRSLLDRLPNCIKANAILAEVWLAGGRHDEAQSYLERLKELTLPDRSYRQHDTPLGHALNANGSSDLPHQVLVNRLEYEPPEGAESDYEPFSLDETPDWLRELELAEEVEPEDTVAETLSNYGEPWTAPEEMTGQPADDEEPVWLDELEDEPAEPASVPDWLAEEEDEPAGQAPDELDWSAEPRAESEAPFNLAPDEAEEEAGSVPAMDWLDEFAAEMEEQTQPEPDEPVVAEEAEPGFQNSDEMAWLDDLAAHHAGEPFETAGEEEATHDEEAIPDPEASLSDWFDQLPDEIPEDPDEAMAWLENLAAGQTADFNRPAAPIADETEPAVEVPVAPSAWQQFDVAHQALETGDLTSAIAIYEPLLDQPEAVESLIADLETVVAQHRRQPQLLRLLGDGYARHGELDKALEAYRQALDSL